MKKRDSDTLKKGYLYLPNFFNEYETESLKRSIKTKKKNNENFNDLKEESLWDFVSNKKVIEKVKVFTGEKALFLYSASLLCDTIDSNYSWHRDNPYRQTGVGPDWDDDQKYNVVSAILYLNDTQKTSTGLNLIPYSNRRNYNKTFSNLLRWFHWKIKKTNFFLTRKFIEKIIGDEINYKSGDLLIFYCNIFHTGYLNDFFKRSGDAPREAIIARFGGAGKHSINFMKYELNYRHMSKKLNQVSNLQKFYDKLKAIGSFIEPDFNELDKIEGVFIPKKK